MSRKKRTLTIYLMDCSWKLSNGIKNKWSYLLAIFVTAGKKLFFKCNFHFSVFQGWVALPKISAVKESGRRLQVPNYWSSSENSTPICTSLDSDGLKSPRTWICQKNKSKYGSRTAVLSLRKKVMTKPTKNVGVSERVLRNWTSAA